MMHPLHLLLSGITVLREGFIAVDVSDHRERLLAIRSGRITWEAADAWRLELIEEFDTVFTRTTIPERPDSVRSRMNCPERTSS